MLVLFTVFNILTPLLSLPLSASYFALKLRLIYLQHSLFPSLIEPLNSFVSPTVSFPLKCLAITSCADYWKRLCSEQALVNLVLTTLPSLRCLLLPAGSHWLSRQAIQANPSLIIWGSSGLLSSSRTRAFFQSEATLFDVKSRSELAQLAFGYFASDGEISSQNIFASSLWAFLPFRSICVFKRIDMFWWSWNTLFFFLPYLKGS